MSSTAQAVAAEFSDVVDQLDVPAARVRMGTHDDYAYGSYGSPFSGDKPFEMRQQITDQVDDMQTTLNAITILADRTVPSPRWKACTRRRAARATTRTATAATTTRRT
jgi:hypothetical protein